ncbi:MAG: glycosyltransferase family 2 protein [Alphaproteobacteria bacterium]
MTCIGKNEVKSDKTVSVIIPVYNVEKYLPECLDSLLAQTYPHWQAICVNDGSKDNSLQILQQYAAKDKRFVIIDQKNAGVSAARNTALQKASGDYITFLDSDDMLCCQFMEYMVGALENTDSDMVWCLKEKKHGGVVKTIKDKCLVQIYDNLFLHYINNKKPKLQIAVWGKLYKREILKGLSFDSDFKQMAEDFYYSFLVFERVKRAACVKQKLLFYRQMENSLSHFKISEKELDDHITLAKKLTSHFSGYKNPKVVSDMQKMLAIILFRECCFFPYLKTAGYMEYWQKYSKICRELSEKDILFLNKLGWFKRKMCKMFISGDFDHLAFWLKMYLKVRHKV